MPFFPENRAVCEITRKKYGKAGQAIDDHMAHAYYIQDT